MTTAQAAGRRRSAGRIPLAIATVLVCLGAPTAGQRSTSSNAPPQPAGGVTFPTLGEDDAREWLTYLSSDLLQGRQVFTEGYGMAASYIADHLRDWRLQPMGDNGSYFQVVRRKGYTVVSHSTLTVTASGHADTFGDGQHVKFSLLAGANQDVSFDHLFVVGPRFGDASGVPMAAIRGQLVLSLPASTSDVRDDRADQLVNLYGAAAVITVSPTSIDAGGTNDQAASARRGRGAAAAGADLVTVRNVDVKRAPELTIDSAALEALVGKGPAIEALQAQAQRGEPFAPVPISGHIVRLTLDTSYTTVSTQLTENVVGMVPGTDPSLRNTYVFFGAHLDHVGYRQSGPATGPDCRPSPPGDLIYNGADDDGSGSTALLLIAKALSTGPKPKRSIVLIWHAGEEPGLYGSEYMADHPVVPLANVQAELNIDMIGRNRDDDSKQANTVYVIGADRISTDLHNLIVETNQTLSDPLTLNYEYNDPSDPNSFYTRSDHYSYASKGIPIAFFFTGTHPDYHCVTDQVERILFPKLVHVAQMIYETGFALADSSAELVRDNKGPRAGNGFRGILTR